MVLGFEQTSYIVSENVGTANVTVMIFGGEIDEIITLQFSTEFRTAICTLN